MSKNDNQDKSKDTKIHPRYINPATDFGFKRIFKDEEITKGFLNVLLQTEDPTVCISDVSISDGECDESSKEIRRVVYDVHCVTDTGDQFVIEMQNIEQVYFAERIVFYLSRAVSRQQEKGFINTVDSSGNKKQEVWNYHLKNIYGVFFMNFIDSKHAEKLSHFAFMETTRKYQDTDVFQYWKIQMPLYRGMKKSDCKTKIDKWMYNLTNMDAMKEEMPFTEEIPLFMRLDKIASYSALDKQQQIIYDDSYNNYLAYHGQMEFQLQKGIKIGMAEGIAKGIAKGREEGLAEGIAKGAREAKLLAARSMKAGGMSVNEIAKYLDLPLEEVEAL